jgi:Zn-dependent protease with chaperone function
MTREAFVALVERLRPMADANPSAYRWRVRALGLLGYGFILLLILGSLGLVGLLVGLLIFSQRAAVLVIKGGWLLLIFVWRILKSLWVTFERPDGRELTRTEAAPLYASVDRLTKAIGAPRFHHILLTTDFNAAVVQQPRLGVLGWPRNFLLVGLPLLQGLTTEQAEAVIAHELGHLRGGHGKFGAWVYRISQTWKQLMEQLQGQSSWVAQFFNWYSPTFDAWSFGLRRPEEFEADATAARVTNPRTMADALCALPLRNAALDKLHWEPLIGGVKQTAVAPANTFSRLLPVAKTARLPLADEEAVLTSALAAETDAFDTHPSLRDRLAALGQEARLVPAPTVSAAETFFGDQLVRLAAAFDAEWLENNRAGWAARYEELEKQRTRLADLADRHARQRALTPEERWQLADLTEDHVSAEASLPLFRALFDEPSQQAAARFAVGRILLNQDDAEGLALIDAAMARDPNARAVGLMLKQGYYRRLGDRTAAQQLEAEQIRHADLLDLATAERSVLQKLDTYLPHDLPADSADLLTVRRGLADYPDVVGAWLLCKQLTHFAEKPLYVLVVELQPTARRRIEKNEGSSPLVQAIAKGVELPGEGFVVPATNDNAWLEKIAKGFPQARCYER